MMLLGGGATKMVVLLVAVKVAEVAAAAAVEAVMVCWRWQTWWFIFAGEQMHQSCVFLHEFVRRS